MSFVCNLTHLTHTFLNLTDLKKKQFSLYHWPILNIDNEASRTAALINVSLDRASQNAGNV